jgi:hypothetical protein
MKPEIASVMAADAGCARADHSFVGTVAAPDRSWPWACARGFEGIRHTVIGPVLSGSSVVASDDDCDDVEEAEEDITAPPFDRAGLPSAR